MLNHELEELLRKARMGKGLCFGQHAVTANLSFTEIKVTCELEGNLGWLSVQPSFQPETIRSFIADSISAHEAKVAGRWILQLFAGDGISVDDVVVLKREDWETLLPVLLQAHAKYRCSPVKMAL